MTELPVTLSDAAAALRAGALTSVQLTRQMQERADRLDPLLGCYLERLDESALAAAEAADAKFAAGVDGGPLQGIPLGIKDILSLSGSRTTAQSLILDPAWGERGDGPAVARLRAAGAVLMGKLTTMEFAIGAPDASNPFPVPRNPWNLEHWTGGSSSGTGNGVAAGLFYGGLGTDTGGSIRGPASFCGITGMKPTYGRVPKSGCVPLGYSLDHIGPMARSVRDCAIMLGVIAGFDASDPTVANAPVPDYVAALTGDLRGVRVGVERANHVRHPLINTEVVSAFESAVEALAAAGAEIVEIEIPHFREITTAGRVTMIAEALAYHLPDLRSRWEEYGRFTALTVGMAALFSAADIVQAQRVRRYARAMTTELMADLDVLLVPASAGPAPKIEEITPKNNWDPDRPIFTSYWNATGFPAMSVPMGFSPAGLPLGLQIVAKPFEEAKAFRVGDVFQQLTDFHLRLPPILEPAPV